MEKLQHRMRKGWQDKKNTKLNRKILLNFSLKTFLQLSRIKSKYYPKLGLFPHHSPHKFHICTFTELCDLATTVSAN